VSLVIADVVTNFHYNFTCFVKEEALLELSKGIGFALDDGQTCKGVSVGVCEPLDDMHIVLFTYGQVRGQNIRLRGCSHLSLTRWFVCFGCTGLPEHVGAR